jgi:hypothetical protein
MKARGVMILNGIQILAHLAVLRLDVSTGFNEKPHDGSMVQL